MNITASTTPAAARTPSNFERTALEIFDLVATHAGPMSVPDLYTHYGAAAPTLPLAGCTLQEYMEGLMRANYTKGENPNTDPYTRHVHFSYTLTTKGETERARLRELIDAHDKGPTT